MASRSNIASWKRCVSMERSQGETGKVYIMNTRLAGLRSLVIFKLY